MQDRILAVGFKLKKMNPQKLFRHVAHVQGGTEAETGVHEKNHRRAICYRRLLSNYSENEIDAANPSAKKGRLG